MSDVLMSSGEAWKRADDLCQPYFKGTPPTELLADISTALLNVQLEAAEAAVLDIQRSLHDAGLSGEAA